MSKKFDIPDMVVDVEVEGKPYKLDLTIVSEKMLIDPNHLDEELEEQAAFYLWTATLSSEAEMNAEEEKQAFDIFYAELQRDVRLSMESEGGKPPAAATVEAAAKATEEYGERLGDVMEARRTAAILATVRDAVRMRQYTLIERSRRLSKREAAETEE